MTGSATFRERTRPEVPAVAGRNQSGSSAESAGIRQLTRIHVELKAHGHPYGKRRVARLYRAHRIISRCKQKFRVTTNSQYPHHVVQNLLKHKIVVAALIR